MQQKKTDDHRSQEGILPLYSALVRPHTWSAASSLGPLTQQLHGPVQAGPEKMIRGLEYLSYEDRLRELGLLSLEAAQTPYSTFQ